MAVLVLLVIVDAKDAESGRFINSRELIKALTRSSYTGNKLHIELYRAAWNLERCKRCACCSMRNLACTFLAGIGS